MVADFLTHLGRRISSAWSRSGRSPRTLPAVAADVLQDAGLSGGDGCAELITAILRAEALPEQVDLGAAFGQPPVVLYREPDYFLQVLFWLDSPPAIHQHSFSGAFVVLHGSSIHVRYAYTPHGSLAPDFHVGR